MRRQHRPAANATLAVGNQILTVLQWRRRRGKVGVSSVNEEDGRVGTSKPKVVTATHLDVIFEERKRNVYIHWIAGAVHASTARARAVDTAGLAFPPRRVLYVVAVDRKECAWILVVVKLIASSGA